jgi:hypothetical protein
MPSKQADKSRPQQEVSDRETRQATIGHQVMQMLGQPTEPHRVQVRQLWDSRYRVNVIIGVDGVSAAIAHSYFLLVDGDGSIIESTPGITKQYGQEQPCATP